MILLLFRIENFSSSIIKLHIATLHKICHNLIKEKSLEVIFHFCLTPLEAVSEVKVLMTLVAKGSPNAKVCRGWLVAHTECYCEQNKDPGWHGKDTWSPVCWRMLSFLPRFWAFLLDNGTLNAYDESWTVGSWFWNTVP